MPGADLYLPQGSMSVGAERTLVRKLTNLLIVAEGADPGNVKTQAASKIFVHRPVLYVAGEPSEVPHYYFVAMMPEGLFDSDRWKIAVAAMTEAFMEAEEGVRTTDPSRVWILVDEIADGTWGARGRVATLADMLAYSLDDLETGRTRAANQISARRRIVAAELCLSQDVPS